MHSPEGATQARSQRLRFRSLVAVPSHDVQFAARQRRSRSAGLGTARGTSAFSGDRWLR
jgi:hypothetical protein